jgi:anti-anti-sigma factor
MANMENVLTTRKVKGYTVVDIPDRVIDRDDVERVAGMLIEQVEDIKPPRVIFSFAGVNHISSSFLGKMISLNKRLAAKGGKLIVADVDDHLNDVFKLTRLNKQLPVYRTLKQAVSPWRFMWQLLK